MSCEKNIYDRLAEAVKDGLKKVLLKEPFGSDMGGDFIIEYKGVNFDTFSIYFGCQEALIDNAVLNGERPPIFEWYARLDRPEDDNYIVFSNDIFTTDRTLVDGVFELNGRAIKALSESEALDVLLPRVVKRLHEEELVSVLEFLSERVPRLKSIQEAVKEWRLYNAYCEV